MMIKEKENVLKGQINLAQGKRRRIGALGWRKGKRIVRAIIVIKEKFLFSDERADLCTPTIDVVLFRPKKEFRIEFKSFADVFILQFLTQGVALG